MRAKKAIYNIISSLLLQLVTVICGFIVPKIIISNYGSETNGLIASITQFLGYISLMEAGVGGVVRAALYSPLARKNTERISKILKATSVFFKKIAIISVRYMIVVAAVYPFVGSNSFDYWFTFSMVIIIGVSIFAQYFFGLTYQLLLQADQKQYIGSAIQILTLVLNALLVIILTKINSNIIMVEIASSMVFILRPLLINLYVKKSYNINLNCEYDRRVLSRKRDGLAHHIAYFLHTNTDVVVLTLFTNMKEVSIYYVYNLVVSGVRRIVMIFSSGLEATFGNILANNEKENLKNKFNLVNVFVTLISTIFFTTAAVSINSFLQLYTGNFTDADYNRPLLGVFLILAEYMYCVRNPYNSLIIGAGHFRETKKSAYAEALINIILSIIFVNFWGIYGVAFATFIAMLYRTIYYIYYVKRNLINRSILTSIKNGVISIIITSTSILLCYSVNLFSVANDYLSWAFCTIVFFAGASTISLGFVLVFYKNEFKQMYKIIRNIGKRK